MHIVINHQDLLSVLKRSGAAINSKDMVSVRQCILLEAGAQGALTFATTDGQLDIVIDAKGGVKSGGRAVLNHHRLFAIVTELPEGYVEISVDAKMKASIRSSSSKRKFTMTALDAADFPPVLSLEQPAPMYSIESKILLQVSSEVAFGLDAKGDDMPAGAL